MIDSAGSWVVPDYSRFHAWFYFRLKSTTTVQDDCILQPFVNGIHVLRSDDLEFDLGLTAVAHRFPGRLTIYSLTIYIGHQACVTHVQLYWKKWTDIVYHIAVAIWRSCTIYALPTVECLWKAGWIKNGYKTFEE